MTANYKWHYILSRRYGIMAQAYVLLNCELGAEEEIIGKLKELENVKEVHGTFGAYDITAVSYTHLTLPTNREV